VTFHFVQQFRARERCLQCASKPAESRSFCSKHLRRARLEFRSWSAECRAGGVCVECSGTSVPGQLRCVPHKNRNRLRALNWTRSNRDWQRFKDDFRRFTAMSLGVCSLCARKPARAESTRCRGCKRKQTGYRAASTARRGFGC
jgi:hypothetical protein